MGSLPKRKNPRLRAQQYTQGWFVVTICTRDRLHYLGSVVGGDAHIAPYTALSEYGELAERYIRRIPGIDTYVIMPNHIHMIVSIGADSGPMWASAPTTSLGNLVRSFKTLVCKAAGEKIWQRGYYDRIIRNEADYLRIWQYIDQNPAHWAEDEYYLE